MQRRMAYLDGLRGLAALMVVFQHGLQVFTFGVFRGLPQDSRFAWDMWLSRQPFLVFIAGNFAVAIFFVLSGFVLSHVYLHTRSGMPALVAKRYVRLTVPITAANLLSLGLCVLSLVIPIVASGPGFDGTLGSLPRAFMACLHEGLLKATMTGIDVPTYNGVLWTMQIEFVGSLILIGLFAAARATTASVSAAANVAAVMALLLTVALWQSNLALFGVGVLFYRASMLGMPSGLLGNLVSVPLLVVGILLGTMPLSHDKWDFLNRLVTFSGADSHVIASKSVLIPLFDVLGRPVAIPFQFLPVSLWHGVGAVFLMAALLCSSGFRSLLSRQSLTYLGKISFALYLTHNLFAAVVERPIYKAMTSHGLSTTMGLIGALVVYVPFALLVADVFTRLVEGRAMRWSAVVEQWFGKVGQRVAAGSLRPDA